MRKLRNVLFYIVIIGGFTTLMYWIIARGGALETGRNVVSRSSENTPVQEFINSLLDNLHHSIGLLILQIITIILISRFLGWIFKKIGQPMVIGEILAGIVLGPSLLGAFFPEVSGFLFPVQSLGNLQVLSQIGLILFMFIIGMELNLKVLKTKAHDAVVISHASIIIPFALGVGLAYFIYPGHAPEHIKFSSFALFIGISMSITAFPVLARIIQERGIHKTKLGAVVITCAAADDITAWCLLAIVIAIVKAGVVLSALFTIFFAVLYVLFMLKIVRPFLKRIGELSQSGEQLNKWLVALFFLVLLFSSFITETIGIHALFGAFMAGVIMPENIRFRSLFIEKIEDIALVLFLPLFFVISGLRTEVGLLNDPFLWKITGLIILVAVVGKFVGSALAAKFVGQNWRDSLTIGTLMNTRGLMELVVLNIGYDLGVLNAEIFAMMVIMALVTTFMTGPSLNLIQKVFKSDDGAFDGKKNDLARHRFLLFFRTPQKGAALLKIANGLSRRIENHTSFTALHLKSPDGLHHMNVEIYEKESFAPILAEANTLGRKIIPIFNISNEIVSEVVQIANKGEYDLLLMNPEESIFEGSLLGRVLGFTTQIVHPEMLINTVTGRDKMFKSFLIDTNTRAILNRIKMPVGILIDKQLEGLNHVFVTLFNPNDVFLLFYVRKLIRNAESKIFLLNETETGEDGISVIDDPIRQLLEDAPNHVQLVDKHFINDGFWNEPDLILVNLEYIDKLFLLDEKWYDKLPSILLFSRGKGE